MSKFALNTDVMKLQLSQLRLLTGFVIASFVIITIGGMFSQVFLGKLCLLIGVLVMYIGGIKQVVKNSPFIFSVDLWSMASIFLSNLYAMLFMDALYDLFVVTCFIILSLLLVSIYKLNRKTAT